MTIFPSALCPQFHQGVFPSLVPICGFPAEIWTFEVSASQGKIFLYIISVAGETDGSKGQIGIWFVDYTLGYSFIGLQTLWRYDVTFQEMLRHWMQVGTPVILVTLVFFPCVFSVCLPPSVLWDQIVGNLIVDNVAHFPVA